MMESHNVIPISIMITGVGYWDDYEQLKVKL